MTKLQGTPVFRNPVPSMEMIVSDQALSVPSYAHSGDAGLDIAASERVTLRQNEIVMVPTGISVAIPPGFVGFLTPRSGLSSKGVGVANAPGTIDSGYRGELKVLLINHSDQEYFVGRGDRIAQLVIVPFVTPKIQYVGSFGDTTSRGAGGFGSTGK